MRQNLAAGWLEQVLIFFLVYSVCTSVLVYLLGQQHTWVREIPLLPPFFQKAKLSLEHPFSHIYRGVIKA